jgi:hypothetical protein
MGRDHCLVHDILFAPLIAFRFAGQIWPIGVLAFGFILRPPMIRLRSSCLAGEHVQLCRCASGCVLHWAYIHCACVRAPFINPLVLCTVPRCYHLEKQEHTNSLEIFL